MSFSEEAVAGSDTSEEPLTFFTDAVNEPPFSVAVDPSTPYGSIYKEVINFGTTLASIPIDENEKRYLTGKLPIYYKKTQRDLAKKLAEESSYNAALLDNVTSPHKTCVNPAYSTNSQSYCQQTLSKDDPQRVVECKNLMCQLCCDSLPQVLKHTATLAEASIIHNFSQDSGYSSLRSVINSTEVEACRTDCQRHYPVSLDGSKVVLYKDPDLGKTKEYPALSCADIKTNGENAPSGVYFIGNLEKTVHSAYCDMDNTGGGWTLLLAYAHNPAETYELDGTILPQDPDKGKSHMNLSDAGFSKSDATELRFFCNSSHATQSGQNRQMHFTTNDKGMVNAAYKGDQRQLSVDSFKKSVKPVKEGEIHHASILPQSVTAVSNSATGGLWMDLFSNPDQEARWSIRGSSGDGRWECDDLLTKENGAKFKTIHQVWFRGTPPSPSIVSKRLTEHYGAENPPTSSQSGREKMNQY